MKYLMLIKHAESYRNEAIPQALMAPWASSSPKGSGAAS
jgi:hypothetical protein